jgi:hypothetical protein
LATIASKDDSKTSELLGMKLCEWEVKISELTAPMLTDCGAKRNNSVILRDLIGGGTSHTELPPVSCPLFYTLSVLIIETFFPKTTLGLIQSSL